MKRNNNRILLVQTFPLTQGYNHQRLNQSIREENGSIYLTGIIQRADAENGNGRVYPKEILQRQVLMYQQLVKNRMSAGQMDHPDHDIISIAKISHYITKIWWEGNEVWGEFKITSNDVGRNVQALIKDGLVLATSSRALGSLKRVNNQDVVQDDLQLICFDLVTTPSTKGAYFRGDLKKQSIENRLNDVIEDKPYTKIRNSNIKNEQDQMLDQILDKLNI